MHAAGERSGKKAGGAAFFHAGNGKRKQRKPGEPVRAGPGGRKRRGGGTGAGHDAGERELLFPHRPLSSDFSGTSFFTKGEPVCFRPFLGRATGNHKFGSAPSGNDRRYEKVRKKRMKKQLVLAALAFCLLFSDHSMAAEKNGWRSESGGSVYYVKGTRVKGLKKIGSHTYYFKKEDGTLLKNRWLLYKGKYYYFQSRGRKGRCSCHQSMDR